MLIICWFLVFTAYKFIFLADFLTICPPTYSTNTKHYLHVWLCPATTPRDRLVSKLRIGKCKHGPRCCRGKTKTITQQETTQITRKEAGGPNEQKEEQPTKKSKRNRRSQPRGPASPTPPLIGLSPVSPDQLHWESRRFSKIPKVVGQVFINSFKVQCCHLLSWRLESVGGCFKFSLTLRKAPSVKAAVSMKRVFIRRLQ